ncbi:hydroxyacid dehydrogenase [Streptacidiphilus albus]|uniref:hydroxyacid dehydrogenase n=1 Tax=Streptacidiphilus albus TaxID=105425 RepID=UPI00054B38A3
MRPALRPLLFDADTELRLARAAAAEPGPAVDDLSSPASADRLAAAEVLVTGWDCPVLDADVLRRAPRLRAVIHAAGSVKHHVTQACWNRGLLVSSAVAENAVPVAEYTLAMVIMSGKRLPALERAFRRDRDGRDWQHWTESFPDLGLYRRTVGVVGCSRVGRRVIGLLRELDVTVLVHDPYLPDSELRALGAIPTGLDELVAASDVVSLHAPATEETRHLMDRRRLALLRDGATLINTARGSLVDTEALVAELRTGRIDAVLDVTEPDPLPADSPLFDLPNVTLTPHVAGSLGGELHRMGAFAVAELERYAAGRPLVGLVHPEHLASSA